MSIESVQGTFTLLCRCLRPNTSEQDKNGLHLLLNPRTGSNLPRQSRAIRCFPVVAGCAFSASADALPRRTYPAIDGAQEELCRLGSTEIDRLQLVWSGRGEPGVKMKMSMFILHAPLNSDGRTISPQLTQALPSCFPPRPPLPLMAISCNSDVCWQTAGDIENIVARPLAVSLEGEKQPDRSRFISLLRLLMPHYPVAAL